MAHNWWAYAVGVAYRRYDHCSATSSIIYSPNYKLLIMTIFNPEKKDVLTFAECLDPAMTITDQEDANNYFIDYCAYIQKALEKEPREDNKSAEQIARINLGYYSGYCGVEVQKQVQRLFLANHPIFGPV